MISTRQEYDFNHKKDKIVFNYVAGVYFCNNNFLHSNQIVCIGVLFLRKKYGRFIVLIPVNMKV